MRAKFVVPHDVVRAYWKMFVNTLAYTVQSPKPHVETGRHAYRERFDQVEALAVFGQYCSEDAGDKSESHKASLPSSGVIARIILQMACDLR